MEYGECRDRCSRYASDRGQPLLYNPCYDGPACIDEQERDRQQHPLRWGLTVALAVIALLAFGVFLSAALP
jgi:hypothetical protein